MTEHEWLVRWCMAVVGGEHQLADLPNGCFASPELWQDGLCYAMISCDGQQTVLITDIFTNRAVAQAWVEDKVQLLTSGPPSDRREPNRVPRPCQPTTVMVGCDRALMAPAPHGRDVS